jgi:hypothetical protein
MSNANLTNIIQIYYKGSNVNNSTSYNHFTKLNKRKNLIYSDDVVSDWNEIIPNTYAEGYYRLFCIALYKDNPSLN